MKRNIIIVALIICLVSCTETQLASAYTVDDFTYDDMDLLIELIEEQEANKDAAHQMAEAARYLSCDDVTQIAGEEYQKAQALQDSYQEIYDNLAEHWQQKKEEYPVATYIWEYFKDLGYSNFVIAGILGNIMAEAGHNSLDILYDASSTNHYGICQWNRNYYSEIVDASLEEQCRFLSKTIKYEMDTYGCGYSSFIEMTDVRKTAISFAKGYERCGFTGYSTRERNAVTAYNYFVS